MARFTLHGVAPNRPGIVAAVTQSLAHVGCNLEDCRMSLLRGQFSIVLVLEAPGVASGAAVEEALAPLLEEFALQLLVRPIQEDTDGPDLGHLVVISVHGADHPGILARTALAVAAAGGDVVDLVGHVVRQGQETPSHIEITASMTHEAVPELRAALGALAAELGVRYDLSTADSP
ncbi:MAG: glycine cleavage system protein R [Acidimicrobiales bacterium]